MKGVRFDEVVEDHCLVKSLTASANGCGSPAMPTLLGPFRVWK